MDTLSREDRALTYELVMSTLRWQSELDARIAQYSSQKVSRLDGEVRVALRLGACQLSHLERIPAHAAVHESVELVKSSGKRSAVPYANAVLRKLAANARRQLRSGSWERRGGCAATYAAPAAGADARELALALRIRSGWLRAGSTCMDITPHAPFARPISVRRQPALRLSTPTRRKNCPRREYGLRPERLLTEARRLLSGDLAHSLRVPRSSRGGAGRSVATGGCAGGKRRADSGLLRRSGRKNFGDRGAQSGGENHRGGIARASRKSAERAGCGDEREGGDAAT